ncbi:MAG: extradiol ring-cleavage dioxygenase [Deltaproteobacteria bacterium]|nr:extradiol ring-cleavage dioxygenase [Deltaproteobacteria bacterium]
MAEIVLGIATSHSPQLRIPPQQWHLLIEKDENDPRFNYAELLRKADPALKKELSEEVFTKKYQACQTALSALQDKVAAVRPDVAIVIGDDQHEQFFEENMPVFSIYYNETVEQKARSRSGGASWWNVAAAHPDEKQKITPAHSELARHLIKSLIAKGFDIATSNKLRSEIGVGHAYTFVINRVLTSDAMPGLPIVPLMINAFYPPNQPLPGRCYALGNALAEAVKRWPSDMKVAVVASGGLSHFIIDEEIDRASLDGLLRQDRETLCGLPIERLMVLGTGEILNWVAAAGALEHLKPQLLDYLPCYRTPAGTGCAMGFMQWN